MSLSRPSTATAGAPLLVLSYGALALVVLAPLLGAAVPVLVDYPNHLARMWLMAREAAGQPSANYLVHWQVVPNLAMEFLVPPLIGWLSVETAGRCFIAVAMLLPVLGSMALHRVLFGRVGLWPLASFLFVYHAVLQWGFMNFLFSMGVALLLFAGWLASQGWRMTARIALFAPAAVILFLLHLVGFGIYGLLVGAHAGGQWLSSGERNMRGLLRHGYGLAQFLPALVLWGLTRQAGGPTYTAYGDLSDKLYAFTAPMGFGVIGPLLGFCCFPLTYLAWRARWLRFAPGMGWPLMVLLLAAMAMPNWIMGSWQADIRIPAFLPFLLIGISQPGISHRAGRIVASLALVFLLIRSYALDTTWRDLDRQQVEFRAATQAIPRGARLLVVQSELTGIHAIPGWPVLTAHHLAQDYIHLPTLAVIDRDAFVPYLFLGWSPVRPTQRNETVANVQGNPVTPAQLNSVLTPGGAEPLRGLLDGKPYWTDWPRHFEYAVWIYFDQPPSDVPTQFTEIHAGSFFRLYRIARP